MVWWSLIELLGLWPSLARRASYLIPQAVFSHGICSRFGSHQEDKQHTVSVRKCSDCGLLFTAFLHGFCQSPDWTLLLHLQHQFRSGPCHVINRTSVVGESAAFKPPKPCTFILSQSHTFSWYEVFNLSTLYGKIWYKKQIILVNLPGYKHLFPLQR